MILWRALSGTVRVELTSANLTASLAEINRAGIEIRSLQWKNELTCCCQIQRKNYQILRNLSDKRGDSLRVINRSGIIWYICSLWKRPLLILGLLTILILAQFLSNRVLFVCVQGNEMIPSKLILESAEKLGLTLGISGRDIRSETIKNGLLSQIPDLQWAGVNTSGCVAIISVQERTDKKKTENSGVSSIIAAKDGYILSGIVEKGTAMFQNGQTVQKGQLLISGYTDCGFCIRAERATGTVMAQTMQEITAVTPEKCFVRTELLQTRRKVSLIIGKKRINLWKGSSILDATCGRIYNEYYVTLPGGFRLPIAICVDRYQSGENMEYSQNQTNVHNQLRGFSRSYLQRNMIAGSIRNTKEHLSADNGLFIMEGVYNCTEMIGREQLEQIGEINGKND